MYLISDESVLVSESSTSRFSDTDGPATELITKQCDQVFKYFERFHVHKWLYALRIGCAAVVASRTNDSRPRYRNPACIRRLALRDYDGIINNVVVCTMSSYRVNIDYRLYPRSYKYAYVDANPTHESRPLPADGEISPPGG